MKTKRLSSFICAAALLAPVAELSFCFAEGSRALPGGGAFEGYINAAVSRGNQTDNLRYTVGTNHLRVEVTASDRPNAVDILDRNSGELTLLFLNNRTFARLKAGSDSPNPPRDMPAMPTPSQMPAMPAMPMMTPPMMEKTELHATGQKTNLLGCACERYEIRQRNQTMEIWATDELFPFQPYLQNQLPGFSPRTIEEQWSGLLRAKKLFPLLAILKFENGIERFRFEVKSVTPRKLMDDDAKLFQPPTNYTEIQSLPF